MQRVKEIMTAKPVYCNPDTSLKDVAQMMCDADCGEIPVVESLRNPKPIGVITDRDITCRMVAEGKNPLHFKARDCMTTPCVTMSAETSVEECCEILERHQIRRVPVIDSTGQCCGIISQADIALKTEPSRAAEFVRYVSSGHTITM